MRRIAVFTTVLTLLLLANARAQTSTAIVAGQSVGVLRIGGNANEAVSVLGSLFDQEDSRSGKYTLYDWPLKPLAFIAEKESGRIVMIFVGASEDYRTDRGVASGTERQAVESAYGREFTGSETSSFSRMVYDGLGIAFFIGRAGVMSGRVLQIVVFAPGQWMQIMEGL